MDKLIDNIFYRGINVMEDVLSPLLGDIIDIESTVSMRLNSIKAGPFTEMTFGNGNDEFTVWITGSDRDTASFKQTGLFKIGYRGGKDDAPAVQAAEIIADLVQKNEQMLKDEIFRVVFFNEVKTDLDVVLFYGMAEQRLTLKCNEKCHFCNTIVDESAYLHERYPVSSFTLRSLKVAIVLKREVPEAEISPSTLAFIDSVVKAMYWKIAVKCKVITVLAGLLKAVEQCPGFEIKDIRQIIDKVPWKSDYSLRISMKRTSSNKASS